MSSLQHDLFSFLLILHCFFVLVKEIHGKEIGSNGRLLRRKAKAAKKLEYPEFLRKSGKVKSKKGKSSKSKSTKSGKGKGSSSSSDSYSHSSSSRSWDDCFSRGKGKGYTRGCKSKGSNSTPHKVPTAAPSHVTSYPTTGPSQHPSSSPSVVDEDSFPSQAPSSFPSIEFDLQVCESYSRRW